MSTKSTIFLTKDDEHFYSDCSHPISSKNGEYLGDVLILEMSKKNINILVNDNEDLIIEIFNAESELYEILSKL